MQVCWPGGCGIMEQIPTMSVCTAKTFPGKTPESCSKGALGPSATVHLEQNPNVFPGPLWPEPMLTMK